MGTFNLPAGFAGRELNVLVIGAGGTGSELIDELYRISFMLKALGGQGLKVTVYDPDEVSPFNLGRQRFLPADIGHNKAKVLVQRYQPYGAENWEYRAAKFDIDMNVAWSDLTQADFVFTAVDSGQFRYDFGKAMNEMNNSRILNRECLWIDAGNGDSSGQVIMGHLYNPSEKLPNVYDLYRELLTGADEDDAPSCSFEESMASQDLGVNKQAARHAANLLWQLCRHGGVEFHGCYFSMRDGESTPLAIDPSVWATYGYTGDRA